MEVPCFNQDQWQNGGPMQMHTPNRVSQEVSEEEGVQRRSVFSIVLLLIAPTDLPTSIPKLKIKLPTQTAAVACSLIPGRILPSL
eukprot:763380-Hanusia_phi.AAC.4